MDEEHIINMITFNAFLYKKYEEDKYCEDFHMWMCKYQKLKGFNSIDETCDYLIAQEKQKNTVLRKIS